MQSAIFRLSLFWFTFCAANVQHSMVGGNRELYPAGNQLKCAGWWQAFPWMDGEEASVSWTWTRRKRNSERLLCCCVSSVGHGGPRSIFNQSVNQSISQSWRVFLLKVFSHDWSTVFVANGLIWKRLSFIASFFRINEIYRVSFLAFSCTSNFWLADHLNSILVFLSFTRVVISQIPQNNNLTYRNFGHLFV